jgi:hypothetical protein
LIYPLYKSAGFPVYQRVGLLGNIDGHIWWFTGHIWIIYGNNRSWQSPILSGTYPSNPGKMAGSNCYIIYWRVMVLCGSHYCICIYIYTYVQVIPLVARQVSLCLLRSLGTRGKRGLCDFSVNTVDPYSFPVC